MKTNEEITKIASGIITDGFDAGLEHDDIKGNMFSAGVPFGKINATFKTLAIELGLMKDPAEVREALTTAVEEYDWEGVDEWAEVETASDGLAEETGATYKQALSAVRKYCKESVIDLPKAVKKTKATGGTGGKCPSAIVDYFNSYDNPTKQGCFEAVLPLVKGEQNARDYTRMFFPICWAVKFGIDMKESMAQIKDQEIVYGEDAVEGEEEA